MVKINQNWPILLDFTILQGASTPKAIPWTHQCYCYFFLAKDIQDHILQEVRLYFPTMALLYKIAPFL